MLTPTAHVTICQRGEPNCLPGGLCGMVWSGAKSPRSSWLPCHIYHSGCPCCLLQGMHGHIKFYEPHRFFTSFLFLELNSTRLQGSTKRPFPGVVNFVPAVAYHFCLNLPAAFSQPGNSLILEPCTNQGGTFI